MYTFGCGKSDISDFDVTISPGSFPEFYSLKSSLSAVRDQGSTPKCVSVSLTDIVNYKLNYLGGKLKDDSWFFDNRPDKSMQGMIPKDALRMASMHIDGISYTVRSYSLINTIDLMKFAIVSYGPVMVCLYAKSMDEQFWKGYSEYGGHAVLFTGYDSNGFELRNSWGYSYGIQGYTTFPYEDFDAIFEAWAVID